MKKNNYDIQFAKKFVNNKENIKQIPSKPGWYKWWAKKEDVIKLLNSEYIENKPFDYLINEMEQENLNKLIPNTTAENEIYYAIYVGSAVKESIRNRLNWHINQKNNKNNVKSGLLSTFRKSISSLVAGNQLNSEATISFIENLIIEYHLSDNDIKSIEAKNEIEKIEKEEINKYVRIINIKDNKNEKMSAFKKELKKARKNAKIKALKNRS